jgi:hypothetical protein
MALEIYHLRATGERGEELLDAHGEYGRFAEAVDDDLYRRGGPPLPCLMTFTSGRITHRGTLFVGNKAAEGRKRVNISKVEALHAPLRTADIVDRVVGRLKTHVRDRLRTSGVIAGPAALALLEAIRTLDPRLAAEIERFEFEHARVAALPPRTREALAFEKEMVGTALSFSGIDRRELQNWEMPADDSASFLDGLPQVRLREDAMIMNDMQHVPGFEYVGTKAKSAAQFRNGDVTLTLVLANHLALEEQLGADLLYYNETYLAFTLIQYKAMERGEMSTAVFRIPNRKLDEEIDRMRRLQQQLRDAPANDHCNGFRLLDNPFYLKLCPRIDFEPADTGLVKGMYLPLDYWDLLVADPTKVGPRGGRQVSFENVGRHFDNTSFIPLVASGWVGTTAEQSAILAPIVRELVSQGRSLTIAVSRSRKKPPPLSSYTHQRSREDEQQHVRLYRR